MFKLKLTALFALSIFGLFSLAGTPETWQAPESGQELDVLARFKVSENLVREVTPESIPPVAEFLTEDGNFYAFYADGIDGGYFEYIPEGNTPTAGVHEALTFETIFKAAAPEGTEVPTIITTTSESMELRANDPTLEEPVLDWDVPSLTAEQPASMQQDAQKATLYCSKNASNSFYNSYRPGVYSSEAINATTSAGNTVKLDRRGLQYRNYGQVDYNISTPNLTGYLRASALLCSGSAITLSMAKCANSLNTYTYGCGNPGSDIHSVLGPFTFSGGNATYVNTSNGDILRAKLTGVSYSNEQATWSVYNGSYSQHTITGCYR